MKHQTLASAFPDAQMTITHYSFCVHQPNKNVCMLTSIETHDMTEVHFINISCIVGLFSVCLHMFWFLLSNDLIHELTFLSFCGFYGLFFLVKMLRVNQWETCLNEIQLKFKRCAIDGYVNIPWEMCINIEFGFQWEMCIYFCF